MQAPTLVPIAKSAASSSEGGGGGGVAFLVIAAVAIFLLARGKGREAEDEEQLGGVEAELARFEAAHAFGAGAPLPVGSHHV